MDIDDPADLLRVIRRGRAVKNAVDAAIDQCGEVENLRDSIEDARLRAEQANDEGQRRVEGQTGEDGSSLLASPNDHRFRTAESTTILLVDGLPGISSGD